eukprot:TRINITY_DN3987_c0_g1_i6.p3 TRINITY_DN3987_c0_g1~~TRINITY_DN3987_c0_g1_i6.p3  ORF type:complete len:102 (+),score=57.05 TRINITY_DN3987_c0_g1_i6:64-369(+)
MTYERISAIYFADSESLCCFFFFFFNDTATTEIYTRSIVGSVRCVQETGINAEYMGIPQGRCSVWPVSYTHLRAHETSLHLVCRLLLEKKKKKKIKKKKIN